MEPGTIDESMVRATSRRKRAAKRARLMDEGQTPDAYGPGTPVAIYARVSTEEQAEGFSLDAQEQDCRQLAEERKWLVTNVYCDPGFSGKDTRRPGLQKLLNDVRNGQALVVVVHKLDRLSRSMADMFTMFQQFNDQKIALVSKSEQFDFSTPQGKLVFAVLVSFARWYLDNLSAETVKGKCERARQGYHNGQPPFGYISVPGPDGRHLAEQVAEEAGLVRRAFEDYATGQYTDRQIAAMLEESGLRTRRGRHWSKDTVRELLQNEFYVGVIPYRGSLCRGRHTPLISEELFSQCQEVRATHARRPRSYMALEVNVADANTSSAGEACVQRNLLSRIIRCGTCGRHLRIQQSGNRRYYADASRERGLDCVYAGRTIRMDAADRQVLALLSAVRLPDDWQQEIQRSVDAGDVARQAVTRRDQLLARRARIAELYRDGAIEPQVYRREMEGIKAELESLVIPDSANVLDYGLQIEALGELLNEGTPAELHEIVHLILEEVYVDLGTRTLSAFKPTADCLPVLQLAAAQNRWVEDTPGVFTLPCPDPEAHGRE